MTLSARARLWAVSLVTLLAGAGCARPPCPVVARGANPSVPRGVAGMEVYVVATAHGFHLKRSFGYSYMDLWHQIVALKPGLVCGEVVAADHGKREWMYPSETAVVESAAARVGATFHPADWRPHGFADATTRAIRQMTRTERSAYNHAYARFMPVFKKHFGRGLFRFFHSRRALRLLRGAHETMIGASTDIGAGFWNARNQMIVKRCMRKALAIRARRVVFAFGGDHKYGIEEYLARFYRLRARPVKPLFTPSNAAVPREVLANWRRRVEQLEAALKKPAPKGEADSLVSSYPTKRILRSLKKALKQQGRPR